MTIPSPHDEPLNPLSPHGNSPRPRGAQLRRVIDPSSASEHGTLPVNQRPCLDEATESQLPVLDETTQLSPTDKFNCYYLLSLICLAVHVFLKAVRRRTCGNRSPRSLYSKVKMGDINRAVLGGNMSLAVEG